MVVNIASEIMKGGVSAITALIYGQSGVGKTWLAAQSSDRPLIILTEKNGITSIGHSNPNALIVQVSTAEELFELILDARDKKIDVKDNHGKTVKQIQFDTLVVDSLTEAQRLIRDRILRRAKREDMTLKDWGTMANHMERFIRQLRDLPVHVICTALIEYYNEESTGLRHCQPMFEGKKTGQNISQYFNFVGYYYRKDTTSKDGVADRHLMLDGASKVACKSCHPVNGTIKNPDLKQIIKQIQQINKTQTK